MRRKFFQGFAQAGVLVGVDGVESGENHGLDFFEAGQGFEGGVGVVGDGVADFGVGDILDVGDDEADFAGHELVDLDWLGREHAESFRVESCAVPPEADSVAFAQRPLKDASEHDDAAVRIEPGVENQRLEPVVGRALGRRNALHDGFENVGNALAGFGADEDGVGGVEADGAFDHFFGARDVGALQIDLVDDGNNFEAVIDGEIGIGQRLGFDALRGIDHEQRAFAGSQRARDFVGKIHVAGSVD